MSDLVVDSRHDPVEALAVESGYCSRARAFARSHAIFSSAVLTTFTGIF